MIVAMSGGIPDMVPVCPDVSNYVPCRFTRKPYWDVYFHQDPPLHRAYLDVVDRFKFDAWNTSSWDTEFLDDGRVTTVRQTEYDSSQDAMIQHTRWQTPDGPLTMRQLCFRGEPPTPIEKPIKDLARDLPRWFWMLAPPNSIDLSSLRPLREEYLGRGQAFGLGLCYPGLHFWFSLVQNGLEVLSYAAQDCPELLDEWHERHMAQVLRQTELCLEQKPDYLFLGGSGTVTMSSPSLARRYALPTLKAATAMARRAGVPTLLHCCGKSWDFMRMLHEESDLSCFNPVELPPHGDAELASAKRAYGPKLALMGNLHTTDVMLRGSAAEVRRASLYAMNDAGHGGGFILSTGDQCPRDVPEENLHAMIQTARQSGSYDRAGQLVDVTAALAK